MMTDWQASLHNNFTLQTQKYQFSIKLENVNVFSIQQLSQSVYLLGFGWQNPSEVPENWKSQSHFEAPYLIIVCDI